MKAKTLLQLSLLILGSLPVLGLRELPSNRLMQRAVCCVICKKLHSIYSKEFGDCKDKCISDRHDDIPLLDVGAEVNARYLCHRRNLPIVKMDPGVFIVEYRNESSDWIDEGVFDVTVLRSDFGNHQTPLPAGQYQWRFSRAFAHGISRPEITKWITEPGDRNLSDVKPVMKALDIWVQCLVLEHRFSGLLIAAQISFRSTDKAFSCFYNVTLSQDDGTYNRTIEFSFLDLLTSKTTFSELGFSENFTITVQPSDPKLFGGGSSIEFSTPPGWPRESSLKICVPNEPEGLNATITHHKVENDYDVNVTWHRPDYIPDFFIVNLTHTDGESNESRVSSHNVTSGTATGVIFERVKIVQQFNVSIRAWSWLGVGPETSRTFTIPDDRTADASGTIIITVVLVSVSLVAIGVCAYLLRKKRRQRQNSIESAQIQKHEIVPNRSVMTRVLGDGAFGVFKFSRLRDD